MTFGAIDLVLFDYGGVLAAEGFRAGLMAIATAQGRDPNSFFQAAREVILSCGYLTGRAAEADFWAALRSREQIDGTDEALRAELLSRFVLRPWMLALVRQLRCDGVRTAILSDQTNWLDELNERDSFFPLFDGVCNSYHLHRSKHDPAVFGEVVARMQGSPAQTLFIDDTEAHVTRARQSGLHGIVYTNRPAFARDLAQFFPGITLPPAA